jgi:hypothetical protein
MTNLEHNGILHNMRRYDSKVYYDIIYSYPCCTRLLFLLVQHTIFFSNNHQPINVPTAGAQAFLMDYT